MHIIRFKYLIRTLLFLNFLEFWEYKFNCSFSSLTPNNSVTKQCTGREKLTERYKQDTKMAFVVKAIWTMAYGLHSMQQSLCPGTNDLCKGIFFYL